MKKLLVILCSIALAAALCVTAYADGSESAPEYDETSILREPQESALTVIWLQADGNHVEMLAWDGIIEPFPFAYYIIIEDISAIPVSDGALETGAAVVITFKDFYSAGELIPTDEDILKIELSDEPSPLDQSELEAIIAKTNYNLKSDREDNTQFSISSDGKITKIVKDASDDEPSPETGKEFPIVTAIFGVIGLGMIKKFAA